jgi:hypothetical protein
MEWLLLAVVALAMIPISLIGFLVSWLIREIAFRAATYWLIIADELKDERR